MLLSYSEVIYEYISYNCSHNVFGNLNHSNTFQGFINEKRRRIYLPNLKVGLSPNVDGTQKNYLLSLTANMHLRV